MEIQEGRFDSDSKVDEDMAEFCNGMSGSMQVSRIACWSGSGGVGRGERPLLGQKIGRRYIDLREQLQEGI